jgi:hypothetical protein
MLPGVTIAMGGQDWLVPRSLDSFAADAGAAITDIGASMSEMQITVLVEIVATAMRATILRQRQKREPADRQCQHGATVLTGSGLAVDSRLKRRPRSSGAGSTSRSVSGSNHRTGDWDIYGLSPPPAAQLSHN